MGRIAYAENPVFRARFDELDAFFREKSGWSLTETMLSEDNDGLFKNAEIVQPLLFACQSSLTAALREYGLTPAAVFGHSAGEVAAAEASGGLSMEQAAEVIQKRSANQEQARGTGTMAVLVLSQEEAREAIADGGYKTIEISAINSPRNVTVSGSGEEIRDFAASARKRRWVCKVLDLDYPFHNELIAPFKDQLLADLSGLTPAETEIPFISTVTGDIFEGGKLNEDYWWRNVREPVQFLKRPR